MVTAAARPEPVAASPPLLYLGRRAYWALSLAVVAAYWLLWLSHFQYVYGLVMDDYLVYLKGMATVQDWKGIFLLYNAHHLYSLLISYVPLAAGLSLPSYPLPFLDAQTGVFRFLMLYMVFLHGLLLLEWAWFAASLVRSRIATLLSLLLFATTPSMLLWSPKPDTRILGLLFILPALWLLLRHDPITSRQFRSKLWVPFLAGLLLGVGESIHYTAFYLIAPAALVLVGTWLWRGWRRPAIWAWSASFGSGLVLVHASLEYLSHFAAGIPWAQGPTMTMLSLRQHHASPWSAPDGLSLWAELFVNQMGLPLLLAMLVGWGCYVRGGRAGAVGDICGRVVIGLAMPLALVYLVLSTSMPLFRETSVLQPFLYLFAGVAIVTASRLPFWGRRFRLGASLALPLAVGIAPWTQSAAVFEAHQGLGRALNWAYGQAPARPLVWPAFGVVSTPDQIVSRDELEALPPEARLIVYYPAGLVANYPALRPYLESAAPLGAWPVLYATDTAWAELKGFGHVDYRSDPLLREVRILEVGALQEALRGPPLVVKAVLADSSGESSSAPLNVLDQGRSPDRTVWASGDDAMPHWLEVQFAAAVPLGQIEVVLPTSSGLPRELFGGRIGELTIAAADERGVYRTVWRGRDLERYPTIAARWDAAPTTSLKLLIESERLPVRATRQAIVEELVFPGYQVVAPPPRRAFPELRLDDLRRDERGILVTGANLTPQTALVPGDRRMPLRWTGHGVLAVLPDDLLTSGEARDVYLTDGWRRSNTLPWPPVAP